MGGGGGALIFCDMRSADTLHMLSLVTRLTIWIYFDYVILFFRIDLALPGSLSALVYQHSITPISLPCALLVPDKGNKSVVSLSLYIAAGLAIGPIVLSIAYS